MILLLHEDLANLFRHRVFPKLFTFAECDRGNCEVGPRCLDYSRLEFELGGDIHVLGAAEHLGIDYVGDDGLIFAGKVFVQQLRKVVT